MSDCCTPKTTSPAAPGCCAAGGEHTHAARKSRPDFMLWICLALSVLLCGSYLLAPELTPRWVGHMRHGVYELLSTMWWGVVIGALFVGVLVRIPQALVLSVLGRGGTMQGLVRATLAGVLLDLCSHGILMVGAKLYQKGASLGQVMAFLIASPWNSFSLTLIMIALVGLPWTLTFIALSLVIALLSGWLFDKFVARGVLPANPYTNDIPQDPDFRLGSEVRKHWRQIEWRPGLLAAIVWDGIKGSRMVLRWLLFGVLLAAAIRTFVSLDMFQTWFGPSLLGLMLTLVAAAVIEVCSEGLTPIAADLMTRASAPGNSFAFLMAGVATDYTEVMVLRDTTGSWKIALYLPLVTVPQVVVIALILNQLA
jgi:uncharacterized membrane protein YraQ (UPF0718 family)